MKKFEAGKTYYGVFVCDADLTDDITVAKRTAKTLTTTEGKRLKIHVSVDGESEMIYPHGRYSMCMIIRATKEKEIQAAA